MALGIKSQVAHTEIKTARTRLQQTDCGVEIEGVERCPDYTAAIFWSEHSKGAAGKQKTFAIMRNIFILCIILIFLFFIIKKLTGGKKKEIAVDAKKVNARRRKQKKDKSK